MLIKAFTKIEDIEFLQSSWDELRRKGGEATISYSYYHKMLLLNEKSDSPYLVVIFENEKVLAILPCILANRKKRFIIGRRKLFEINYKVIQLIEAIVGEISKENAENLVSFFSNSTVCDAINLYEQPISTPLYLAVINSKGQIFKAPYVKQISPHWLITLPEDMGAYMSKFKSKKRKYLKWMLKNFRKEYQLRLEVITDAQQIDFFLRDGESISKETYQWELGSRLVNSEESKQLFELLAKQKELRAYVLYANDMPVAFVKSKIINGVFHYESTGYLPEYSQWSAGTILLMLVIEDLIEKKSANYFDFGMGGDFKGYKSTFGTKYHETAVIEMYVKTSMKAMFIYLFDTVLWYVKKQIRFFMHIRRNGLGVLLKNGK